jgi:uncharacterized membrane protein YhaH (DUF805 family)
MSWYFRSLKKYADFKGRARRTEYWVFASVQIIISCAFLIIFLGFVGGRDLFAVNSLSILYILYVLAVMVPGCAVAVRRLHDTGRTGWWLIWVGAFIFSYNLVVSPWFQKAYGFCWYNSPCGWYPSTVMTLAVLVGITQICFFAFTVLDSEPGENQYGPNPRAVAVRPEQKVQEQHSKRGICPECGVKYGLIDLMAQPTMCSKCWKKSKSDSIR